MKSKRIYLQTFTALLALLVFLGMGDLSGQPDEDEVPQPNADFGATLIDRSGISTKVRRVSIEGNTYLSGQRGDSKITIPFDRIEVIDFIELTEGELIGAVMLRNGNPVDVELKPGKHCYGAASFGTVNIQLKNLGSIKFDTYVPPPPAPKEEEKQEEKPEKAKDEKEVKETEAKEK